MSIDIFWNRPKARPHNLRNLDGNSIANDQIVHSGLTLIMIFHLLCRDQSWLFTPPGPKATRLLSTLSYSSAGLNSLLANPLIAYHSVD